MGGGHSGSTPLPLQSNFTSDLKVTSLVTSQPSAWCDRVSAGNGWPGVSLL